MKVPWARYLLALLKNQSGIIPYPSFVTLLVTWRCNQRCIMCDIWKKENATEMSATDVDRIFSQLRPLDAVRISGGEPFLRDDLSEIVGIINRRVKPKIVHLTTNGTLTQKILSFIEKIDNPENLHIKISIDALEQEHNRIRASNDAYLRSTATLAELVRIRKRYGFYLGVNQTIVSPQCAIDYEELVRMCRQKGIHLSSEFACAVAELYRASQSGAGQKEFPRDMGVRIPDGFSSEQIFLMLERFDREVSEVDNFFEKIAEKYYLEGLRNRILKKKKIPNPSCVELRNHLRILPNGDVCACLYKAQVIDNLLNPKEGDFEKFWFRSKKLQGYRKIVSLCRDCWVKCEAIPSGIYTGDIIRMLV